MERMILFSDLHLKPESEATAFEVLESIRTYAVNYNIKLVGFLGDFWHLRYQVPVYLLNRVHEELQQWQQAGIQMVMLPGNHDQVDVVGRNALEVFQAFINIAVMTEPGELTPYLPGIFWIPYRKSHDEIQKALTQARMCGCPVVFAHLPIKGALQNNRRTDEDGIPVGMFRGFKKVLLGHYHKRQEFFGGGLAYIGSPYQTRADEFGQDKGFVVYDGNQLEWVTTFHGKRYHRFDGKPTNQELSTVKQGDSVRIVVQTEVEAEQVRTQFKGLGDELVVEAEEITVAAPRYGLTKGSAITDYAEAWVEANMEGFGYPHGEAKKKLLDLFEEIRSTAG